MNTFWVLDIWDRESVPSVKKRAAEHNLFLITSPSIVHLQYNDAELPDTAMMGDYTIKKHSIIKMGYILIRIDVLPGRRPIIAVSPTDTIYSIKYRLSRILYFMKVHNIRLLSADLRQEYQDFSTVSEYGFKLQYGKDIRVHVMKAVPKETNPKSVFN